MDAADLLKDLRGSVTTYPKNLIGFQKYAAAADVPNLGLYSISGQDALGWSGEWIPRTLPTFGLGQSWAREYGDLSGAG